MKSGKAKSWREVSGNRGGMGINEKRSPAKEGEGGERRGSWSVERQTLDSHNAAELKPYFVPRPPHPTLPNNTAQAFEMVKEGRKVCKLNAGMRDALERWEKKYMQ